MSGTERPNFRINCTTAVGQFTYYNEPGSLSDLAVTDDSLAVGGTTYPAFESISDVSSSPFPVSSSKLQRSVSRTRASDDVADCAVGASHTSASAANAIHPGTARRRFMLTR